VKVPNALERDEVKTIVTTLATRGVLTIVELRELCLADHWPEGDFTTALRQAVASGEIRHLGDQRYAIVRPSLPT
jgi:hypothetical protein